MPSTSDPGLSPRAVAQRCASAIATAGVLAGLALWQGRLDLGVGLFIALTLGWIVIRALTTTASPLPVAASVGGRREAILIRVVGVGMLLLPALAIATPLLDFARYERLGFSLWIGLALALAGLWLFWRSHRDLGVYWSPELELREGHALVTSGVYATIRHPMYAALILITAAQACFLGNWIAGLSGLVSFLILYAVRVDHEERMMADRFGSDWAAYAARAGRLIPRRAR
ncbi:MAG: protein-S-isoprenylcysteine O-methyltransferase [Pseudomonadota bacterium]